MMLNTARRTLQMRHPFPCHYCCSEAEYDEIPSALSVLFHLFLKTVTND